MAALRIQVPEELLDTLGESKMEALAQEAFLVKLYDMGETSSGRAAEIRGVSRREFLDILGRYRVSVFDDTMNLADEARLG